MKRIAFTAYEVSHDGDAQLTAAAVAAAGGEIVTAEMDYEGECARVVVDVPEGMTAAAFIAAYGEAGGC